MSDIVFTKVCPYCQRPRPETDFVVVASGKFGRQRTIQCLVCRDARRNKKKNAEYLEKMMAEDKARNKRIRPY